MWSPYFFAEGEPILCLCRLCSWVTAMGGDKVSNVSATMARFGVFNFRNGGQKIVVNLLAF